MLGIDSPPLATTSAGAENAPCVVCRWNMPAEAASPPWTTRSMLQDVATRTPAAAHSSSSIFTISLDETSQNSCPSSFSCQAMPWRSTMATKSHGVKRASADLQ